MLPSHPCLPPDVVSEVSPPSCQLLAPDWKCFGSTDAGHEASVWTV